MKRAFVIRLAVLALFAVGCLPFPPAPATPTPVARLAPTAAPTNSPATAPKISPAPAASTATPAPSTTAAPLPTADPVTKLETIRLAYALLLDKFVSPLSPQLLLEAGWSAAVAEAGRAGVQAADLKPVFKDERLADYVAFSQVYGA